MSSTLFYRAQTTGNMWDTWLYWHEGVHYLFHLSGPGGKWHGISMATSTDAVHWKEHGMVLSKDEDTVWLGTGSTWRVSRADEPPRFILNFSQWKGTGQSIYFAESSDLLHWQRLDEDSTFRPDARWYNAAGGEQGRWDTINALPKPGGGFYGWWTANPVGAPGVGFGESSDGVSWAALPPPQIEWGDIPPIKGIEQGGIAEIDGKFYTMLGQGSAYWIYGSGMFNFVADQAKGPFRPAPANYALLTSPPDRGNAYFTRFYRLNDTLLANHHSLSPVPPDYEVYLAPLKRVEVNPQGVLRLKWWTGNLEAIHDWKRYQLEDSREEIEVTYELSAGMLLEAKTGSLNPAGLVHSTISFGCGDGTSCTRMAIHPDGAVDVEVIAPGAQPRLLERIDRALAFRGSISVRVLVMHNFVELYLDDYLLTVQSLHPKAAGTIRAQGMHSMSYLAPV